MMGPSDSITTAAHIVAALRERTSIIWRTPDGRFDRRIEARPAGLLSGSFDPLHRGHRELRRAAADQIGQPVHYELPICNADKPSLSCAEIERRCAQFVEDPLALTNAATFVEKSRLFPNTVFVVGADTAARILQPRFYEGDAAMRDAALRQIAEQGCRFLVGVRLIDERMLRAQDLSIPLPFQDLFEPLSATRFRRDISSSDIRRKTAIGGQQAGAS